MCRIKCDFSLFDLSHVNLILKMARRIMSSRENISFFYRASRGLHVHCSEWRILCNLRSWSLLEPDASTLSLSISFSILPTTVLIIHTIIRMKRTILYLKTWKKYHFKLVTNLMGDSKLDTIFHNSIFFSSILLYFYSMSHNY